MLWMKNRKTINETNERKRKEECPNNFAVIICFFEVMDSDFFVSNMDDECVILC